MANLHRPTLDEMQRALDERTLLPDEDPSSEYIDDALHWILVYTELLRFKASMIEAAERSSEGMTAAARADIGVDQNLLGAQAQRYRVRLEYWAKRAAALTDARSSSSSNRVDGTARESPPVQTRRARRAP